MVVHAAMVIEDGLLRNQDEEGFLGARSQGHELRHLHELTRDLPLDFFVLYFFGDDAVLATRAGKLCCSQPVP